MAERKRRRRRARREDKRSAVRRLLTESLERRMLLTTVTGVDPPAISHTAAVSANLTATFDVNLNSATVTDQSFVGHSQYGGKFAAVTSSSANVATLSPNVDFFPGEQVQATVTAAVQSNAAVAATPRVWQFRTAVPFGSASFADSGQSVGDGNGIAVALGDLDQDGDLDAFVANAPEGNRIWTNQNGSFTDSGQSLGDHNSVSVALGDFDGDSDLDAFVTNANQGNRIWINAAGNFSDSGQTLGVFDSFSVAVGDLDGDGDLDAFVANRLQGNRIWINDGAIFTDSGQTLGNHSSYGVSLGDLDGDGDLDAFVANAYEGNRVWLNDSSAVFTSSGQILGDHESLQVSLGDVDGDGDLDAFVANYLQGNRVWLNDGGGLLSDSGQILGNHSSYAVSLGDLDGDSDLDAFTVNSYQSNRVWLNDGGTFTDSGQSLGNHDSSGVALGDLDGDGDLDAFVANFTESNRIWLNQNPTLSIAPSTVFRAEGDAGATNFTFTVTRSFDTNDTVNVDYTFAPAGSTPAQTEDFVGGVLPSGTLTFLEGVESLSVGVDVAGDTSVELDESFTATLSNPSGRNAVVGTASATGVIRNDDNTDLGDLPSPFPTLLVDNGAAHIATGPTLGAERDVETDGQPTPNADGDDTTGTPADEDGVTFGAEIFAGQLSAQVLVDVSANAQLDAWVDFNGDGSFAGAGEQIFIGQSVTAGTNLLTSSVPADAQPGTRPARFRVSTAGGLGPSGGAADGEVEDYLLTLGNGLGNGLFSDSGQTLGMHASNAVELGDVDGDGDLDALVGNGNQQANRVWLNQGGLFSDSGQLLGNHSTSDLALGDLDGDGDLDAFAANVTGNRVWINDGGIFADSGQSLGNHSSYAVALGDVDGDGDLDAFVANTAAEGNRVWLNQGGLFTSSGQSLGNHNSRDVALGDLDGDGDLDGFVVNDAQANRVWFNSGGHFSSLPQLLGTNNSFAVSLGDLDGDGDLDAFVANDAQGNRVWLNALGVFTDTGQILGSQNSGAVSLGDLDGDGDLDAFIGNEAQSDRVWLNNAAVFTDSGQVLGAFNTVSTALGDLDGDGDLDALVAGYAAANGVLFGAATSTLVSIAALDAEKAEGQSATTPFTFEVSRTGDVSGTSSVAYTVSGSGPSPADAADFGGAFPSGTVTFGPNETSKTITISVSGDTVAEVEENFTVELQSPSPATTQIVGATASGTIQNDDAATVVVSLPAAKDNTLYETADGGLSNGAGQWLFAGRTGSQAATRIHRALLAFDVASAIPSGSTIVNATLTLTMDRTRSDNNDVRLHRLTSDWGEGTSDAFGVEGQGTEPTPNDATWLHSFFNTTTWSAPGGDFVAAPSASIIVADLGSYEWSTAEMAADVQGWLDDGANFGWIVRGEEVLTRRAQRFVSSESPATADRPVLTVEYLPPPATVAIAAADADKAEGNSGSTPFTFNLTRGGNTSGETSVTYSVTGSGVNPADAADFGGALPSGVVNFVATETSQSITIDISGDVSFEPDESFAITLSNPSPPNTELVTATAIGTIRNDEAPPPSVVLAIDAATIAEAAGAATVTATLSTAATQPVTVDLGFTGTATITDDYTISASQIVIPVGATTGAVTIAAVQDAIDETDETITVDIVAVTNAVESGMQQQTTVIADDDEPAPGPPTVLSLDPGSNTHVADLAANVTVTFDQGIDSTTATPQTLVAHSMSRGQLVGAAAAVATSGATVTLDPAASFFPGELVNLTATAAIQGTNSQPATPRVWQWRAGVATGTAIFAHNQQELGANANSYRVSLGDLDGDGDLDALVANDSEGNAVWLNSGGSFSLGQTLDPHRSRAVALGDLDGDGDLDAFAANSGQGNRVLVNDAGTLVDSGQSLGDHNSLGVALGDVDGDGDLDAVIANANQGNRVWINDGGLFADSGQSLGDHSSDDIVLGDLDGDGDLDAFVANANQPNRVWLNDGDGNLTDSGQTLGSQDSSAVALGDLDGDGDLDALVANYGQSSALWLNNSGVFSGSGQQLGAHNSWDVALGDLDADGDLDAFLSNAGEGNRVWLNADGILTDTGQRLGQYATFGVALGDLDADGDLDAFTANNNQANRIWLNQNPTISVASTQVVHGEGNTGSTTFTFNVARLIDTTGAASVDYAVTTSGPDPAEPNDFVDGVLPSGTLNFTDGIGSLTVSVNVAGDVLVENDEGFTLTLSNPVGASLGVATGDGLIRNDDNVDLGDLPETFRTLLSDNGPAHAATGPTLGAARDVEPDGQPSSNVDGDDANGVPDDEDGVTAGATIFAGQTQAEVVVNASASAKLDAWIDFNGDGVLDRQEQIATGLNLAAGDNVLAFPIPPHTKQGSTGARFRLSSAGGLAPAGSAVDGEVEDHLLTIAAPLGSGVFGEGGQQLANDASLAVALGDLDGDGDLDALFANDAVGNRVWLNDGGQFSDSGQTLGDHASFGISLGDLDGDGDLDAFVSNLNQANRVWLNDGGVFTDSGQGLGDHSSLEAALGDLDGDGDLDAFVANGAQANRVWWNEGGLFTDSDQLLGRYSSVGVALADLDRDGDLDAFIANATQGNRVWRNEGGTFLDSGQSLGDHDSRDLALGDLDGDGDLDALVVNRYQGNRVWLNDEGIFTDSGQGLGDHDSSGVALGDLDADGDLDAYVTNYYGSNHIWLNDGGQFSFSGQSLGSHFSSGAALGDVDDDGDVDAIVANYFGNRLWLNENPSFSISPLELVKPEGNSGATAFTFNVVRSFDTRGTASVDFAFSPSGSNAADVSDFVGATFPGGTLVFPDGVASLSVTIDVAGDSDTETDESFALTLTNPMGTNAVIGNGIASGIIRNDDSLDLGDLPAPFATLLADDGPAHIGTGPMLGATRDSEADGQPTAAADGDDLAGAVDDEDGVSFGELIFAGQPEARVRVQASAAAKLDAWIDFDGDRAFHGAHEQIFSSLDVSPGQQELTFSVPSDARQGATFARFRLSTAGGLAPTGGADDGEVEDHMLVISSPFGSGQFSEAGQLLGDHASLAVALGDFDGDGDLDAFVANGYQHANRVWLNDEGIFTDSGQALGNHSSADVTVGDLDGDGDLDAFVANGYQSGNRVWLNDGGVFSDSGQALGNGNSYSTALGDVDGDGDLDAVVANGLQGNRVWLNDRGLFTDSGQSMASNDSSAVKLGDLDGDGDLDAFVTNYDQGNRVWLNDGGQFTDTGQSLGNHSTFALALGDLDGDGDLDAVTANTLGQANRIWLNDAGQFTDSGQLLGDHFTVSVALGDLDADGDLDVFAGNGAANRVWLNSGGTLADSGQTLGAHTSFGVALGDLDSDGDLDAFSANYYPAQPNRVWLDVASNNLVTVSAVDAIKPEGDTGSSPFTFEVTRTGNLASAVELTYVVAGNGANPADAADFGGTLPSGVVSFAANDTAQTVTIDVLGDTQQEADEEFIVTIAVAAGSSGQVVNGTAHGTIQNDDGLPTGLVVTSLEATGSGFVAHFSDDLDADLLNLYDNAAGDLGPADVLLTSDSTGPVSGSVVVDTSSRAITFIATGDPLSAGSYTVTLRSAADGFVSSGGGLLDGNGDETAGDNYIGNFTVAAVPANSVTLSLPDFVRGPGQTANVPATAAGLPLTIDDGAGVRNVTLSIGYDAALLDITGAVPGPNMPPAASVTLDTSTIGLAVVTFTSTTDLPAGPNTLVNLTASVPTDNANAIYLAKQVLDIHSVSVSDAGANNLPVIEDDALHVVQYFGDVTGNARLNASDASRIARVAALLDSGFLAAQLADPIVVGDITLNGRLNAADASRVAAAAALLPVDDIPPIPPGVVTSPITGGPDPKLSLPRDLTAASGDTITVPVQIDSIVDLQQPNQLAGGRLVILYDKDVLTAIGATAGSFMDANPGWSVVGNVDVPGQLIVVLFTTTPVGGRFVDNFVNLQFAVNAGLDSQTTTLNLVASANGVATELLDASDNFLALVPAPTDEPTDDIDGILTIIGPEPPVLADPGTQTVSTLQETLALTLVASDVNPGDTLTYSATLESGEYYLDRALDLDFAGDFSLDFGGLSEKWLLGGEETWYYITPDGNFYEWHGGWIMNRTWLASLAPATYADPSLLYNAQAGAAVPATVSVTGDTVMITPDAGFVGSFSVNAAVTDGVFTDGQLILVNVLPNEAPVLADPGNQTLLANQDTLDLTLVATDSDGETPTFSVTVASGEYTLDQTIGFQLAPAGLFSNWSGVFDERWMLSDDGETWYFITPDGSLYRWFGGGKEILANSELVAALSPSAHTDPSLLYDAQLGGSLPATAGVVGNTLTIDPSAGFVGTFGLIVTATDRGGLSDTRLIRVDVAPAVGAPAGAPAAGFADPLAVKPAADSRDRPPSAGRAFPASVPLVETEQSRVWPASLSTPDTGRARSVAYEASVDAALDDDLLDYLWDDNEMASHLSS